MKKTILSFILCISIFASMCGFTNTAAFDTSISEYNTIRSSQSAAAKAWLPTYKITINGTVIKNEQNKFPFLVYHNTTYMPLTSDLNSFMGVNLFLYTNTPYNVDRVYVGRAVRTSDQYSFTKTKKNNKKQVTTSALNKPLQLNNIGYGNDDSSITLDPPPFVYNGIIYLPLTRYIMGEEFGWDFEWSDKEGLTINTKDPVRPIVFNPSNIDQMMPWTYLEKNPFDYACAGNRYVGIKNKDTDPSHNNIVEVKEKGKKLRNIQVENYGGVWLNSGAGEVKGELAEKGIVYPQLNGNNFTFIGVNIKDKKAKEIKKENLYRITIDITNGKITSADKMYQ